MWIYNDEFGNSIISGMEILGAVKIEDYDPAYYYWLNDDGTIGKMPIVNGPEPMPERTILNDIYEGINSV